MNPPDKNRDRPLRTHILLPFPFPFILSTRLILYTGEDETILEPPPGQMPTGICQVTVPYRYFNIPKGSRKECSMTGFLGTPVCCALRNSLGILYFCFMKQSCSRLWKSSSIGHAADGQSIASGSGNVSVFHHFGVLLNKYAISLPASRECPQTEQK